jgi:protein-disulfide isomerase
MSRLTVLLVAVIAVLGFGLAYLVVRPMPAGMTEDQVRSIVSDAIAAEPAPVTGETVQSLITAALAERDAKIPQSHVQLDAETLNPMIENYLMSNPRILQRVSDALEKEIKTAEREQARVAIASMQKEIFDDPDHVVLGNPNGDVTLVEMFDYNCGFCRQALPDLATLIADDPNLKVVLKEFPILSQESVDAARVAVLVSEDPKIDYWSFHQKLFTARGRVTAETALAAAKDLGMNPVELQLKVSTPEFTAVIDKSYAIARALGVSGTPTYIIGDEVIPGAVGLDQLKLRIANMRACGKTECGADTADAGVSGPQSQS